MKSRKYVGQLEELLEPGDYDSPEARRRLRLRIRRCGANVEILADCPDPQRLDALMDALAEEIGVDEIEAMLCG